MKAVYSLNEKLSFELESVDQKQLFEEISVLDEVFGESLCGSCGSTDIKFVVRENDGNKFYEIKCQKCGARLSFGAHKNNKTLFPKRKGSDNSWLPNRGWVKYVKPTT